MRSVVLLLSLALGCVDCVTGSAAHAPSFESLPRPFVLVAHGVGDNCGGTLAIDAKGNVWHESGCEERSSGVNRTQRLSEAQRSRFGAALDALRHAPDSPTGRCSRFGTLFTLREANGSQREWYVCPPEEGAAWPAPFADVFAAIQ